MIEPLLEQKDANGRTLFPADYKSFMIAETNLDRYSRQMRFSGIGEDGQRKLIATRVAISGCGALGTVIANGLVRAGIGFVRIIDRDFIELNNLQRQLLFDEQDIADNLPKAEAAARKLRKINSQVVIEPAIRNLDATNVEALLGDVDCILDATDNFDTRFLINDFAIQKSKPWIFGACIGSEGQSMTIVPGKTPCLRCFMEDPPAAGTMPTCETAGILSSASTIVASFQVAEAIKILSGNESEINRGFIVFDLWENTFRRLSIEGLLKDHECPACTKKQFDWLEGRMGTNSVVLCGRNAVQFVPPNRKTVDLAALRARLADVATVRGNEYLLRFTIDEYEFSVFPDSRSIIKGTADLALARSLYDRYVGG